MSVCVHVSHVSVCAYQSCQCVCMSVMSECVHVSHVSVCACESVWNCLYVMFQVSVCGGAGACYWCVCVQECTYVVCVHRCWYVKQNRCSADVCRRHRDLLTNGAGEGDGLYEEAALELI